MAALEDLLKLKDEVSKLQAQKDSLAGQIDQTQLLAKQLAQEAHDEATRIVQEAREDVAGKQATLDQREKALSQREADLLLREKAVAYVDAKTTELNDRAEALTHAEAAAEQARTDARAQQQFWVSKLDELKAREEAVRLREASSPPASETSTS